MYHHVLCHTTCHTPISSITKSLIATPILAVFDSCCQAGLLKSSRREKSPNSCLLYGHYCSDIDNSAQFRAYLRPADYVVEVVGDLVRMADIEQALLQQLAESGTVADSGDFAAALQQDHLRIVGTVKSLEAAEMISVEVCYQLQSCCCTPESRSKTIAKGIVQMVHRSNCNSHFAVTPMRLAGHFPFSLCPDQ